MWGPAWGQGFVEFGGFGFGVELGFAFCALALAFFRIQGLGCSGLGFGVQGFVFIGAPAEWRITSLQKKVHEGYMDKRG